MPRGPQGQKHPPKKLEEHESGATRDEVMAALKRASQPFPIVSRSVASSI